MKQKNASINYDIRAKKVLLIDETGTNVGVVDFKSALAKALDLSLDLVEVSSKKNLSVCRIMDYGKWKYEQSKKIKKNTHTKRQMKEIKFRPNIGNNDLEYRAKNADKFLNSGNKVKLTIRFKGREQAHCYETGKVVFEKFLDLLKADYIITGHVKNEGNTFVLILAPGEKDV